MSRTSSRDRPRTSPTTTSPPSDAMAAPAFLGRRRAAQLLPPERAFRPGLAQPESIVYATGVSGYGELLAARRAPPSWWRSIEDRLAQITSQMRASEKRNSQAPLASSPSLPPSR